LAIKAQVDQANADMAEFFTLLDKAPCPAL
jgi:hypothetical protein